MTTMGKKGRDTFRKGRFWILNLLSYFICIKRGGLLSYGVFPWGDLDQDQ